MTEPSQTPEERVARALRSYARRAPAADWLPAASLRRSVDHRRRRRLFEALSVVSALSVSLALAVVLPLGEHTNPAAAVRATTSALFAPLGPGAGRLPATPGPAYEDEVGAGEALLALELLSNTASGLQAGANFVTSPSAVGEALVIAELGAGEASRGEITAVLNAYGLSVSQQAAGWHTLLQLLRADAGRGSFSQRCAIVVRNGSWLRDSYVGAVEAQFGNAIEVAKFASPGAAGAIHAWLASTGAASAAAGNDLAINPSTGALLLDSARFVGSWAPRVGFARNTAPGIFYGSAGQSHVSFLQTSTMLGASFARDYAAVVLPYVAPDMQAIAIEPAAGVSLQSVAGQLTTGSLRSISSAKAQSVHLFLPALDLASDNSLHNVLSAVGMPSTFGAQLSLAAADGSPLALADVQEYAALEVDQRGTNTHSSVSIGSGIAFSHGVQRLVRFDRPFIFLVRDSATGAIVSEAIVASAGTGR
jgi:serpin B